MQAQSMDVPARTARVRQIWDGAQPAYTALVDDKVQAPALQEFIAVIKAHLANVSASEHGETVHRDYLLPPHSATGN